MHPLNLNSNVTSLTLITPAYCVAVSQCNLKPLPHPHAFGSLQAQFARPGRCGDRLVTVVVQVKDTYGATATCGGRSHPEGVHPCPTVWVDPFAGSTADLVRDLRAATASVERKANVFSSSDMMAKVMAVKTARGESCPVSG